MINPFSYSDDNKRYHTLNYHLKKRFGTRIYKAVIDAGFSCPTLDGTLSSSGCSFCLNGSGFFTHGNKLSISQQLSMESQRLKNKYGGSRKMIAYFQAHTNTHAPLAVLKEKYEEALKFENVVGISIATRPDCLDEEKISFLKQLSSVTYLTVELGLQTVHDISARLFNRCYTYNVFEKTYEKLKENDIRVCIHIIDGLYCENEEMILETAQTVGLLYPDAVKISLLHVLKNTPYEKLYLDGWYKPLEMEEYIKIVSNQLTYFPEDCVIERLTGDGAKDVLAAPEWSKNKIAVLGGIDKYMAEHNIYQGMNFKS